ncbi:MAG TPA: efflux RND transporter permease subunit, partial [Synergistaceae bacterium]|nr:efflux RND transporter permease subunit [Synergistaceae bacterium]
MIRFFTGHPTAANLLMSLFMIAGLLSWPRMVRETMPEFTPREVEIRIPYPGATAEDVEDAISQRVEDALEDIEYIQKLRSDSREGLSITLVEMSDGGDFQTFFNDIERSIRGVDDFPEEAEFPVIQELGRTNLVMSLLVSGPLSPGDLKIYAEDLKDRMREAGLPLIDIEGFSSRQLRVTLSESALRQKGFTVPMVTEAILAQSQNKPLGILETSNQDILMRFDDQGRSAQELENLIIWGNVEGGALRLGDVATLENIFDLEEEKILQEGKRCARLNIRKTKAEDTLEVAQRAKAFLSLEKQRFPQMDFTISSDESLALKDRLDLLLRNGVQGLVLVFLVMWLFFHIRISFWVAMGLPVSFLGAFLVAPHLGMTINMFTLVGLLLALGLLMDDAIVIAENIAVHRERGEDPFTAAVEGTREVAAGVISSFITTLCVLGPLGFITGQIGRVLRVVPIMLLLVLAISLIEAFAILPAHLYHAMEASSSGRSNLLRRTLESFLEHFREKVVGKTVDFLLPRRYFVLGAILGLFILSLGMVFSGKIKVQGFPELEGQVVLARLLLPGGTPLARTEERVDRILEALERTNQAFSADQPPGKDLVQNAYVQFNQNSEAFEKGPHVATITVDLLPPEERGGTIEAYLAEWRRQMG